MKISLNFDEIQNISGFLLENPGKSSDTLAKIVRKLGEKKHRRFKKLKEKIEERIV